MRAHSGRDQDIRITGSWASFPREFSQGRGCVRANSCYTLPRAGQSPVTLSLFPIEPLGTPLQPCAPLPNTARAPGAALRIKAKGLTVPPPHQTPVSLFTHPECPPTSTASHRGCSLCIEHSFPSTLCDPASPHQSVTRTSVAQGGLSQLQVHPLRSPHLWTSWVSCPTPDHHHHHRGNTLGSWGSFCSLLHPRAQSGLHGLSWALHTWLLDTGLECG